MENTTAQAKLDAWLFPFMNVSVGPGQFTVDGAIPLAVESRDLLEFRPRLPEFCRKVSHAVLQGPERI